MDSIPVETIEKRPTWTGKITNLSEGASFHADYSLEGTIRPLISSRVKLMFPDRKFKTERVAIGEREYLRVTRVQ